MQNAEQTFKAVHLINRFRDDGRGFLGLEKFDHPDLPYAYASGSWVFKDYEAQSLLGGLIFLHEAKNKPAHFGGLIFDWKPTVVADAKTQDRIIFHFLYVSDTLHADWQGAVHKQAWTGYIVKKDASWSRTNPHGMPLDGSTGRQLSDIPPDYIAALKARSKRRQ